VARAHGGKVAAFVFAAIGHGFMVTEAR
jgi:hypothetical protein